MADGGWRMADGGWRMGGAGVVEALNFYLISAQVKCLLVGFCGADPPSLAPEDAVVTLWLYVAILSVLAMMWIAI
jgi:hypothetical protein